MKNMPYKIVHLKNNLKVLLYPKKGSSSVFLTYWIKCGEINDPYEKKGLAHLLEHLILENTSDFDSEKFNKIQEQLGGGFNGQVGTSYTKIEGFFHKDKIEEALILIKKMLFNRHFPQRNIEGSKKIVLEEMKIICNEPIDIASKEYAIARFQGKYPLRLPVIGSKSTLAKIASSDIKAFYQEHYQPKNCLLIVAGDFEVNNTQKFIEKIFKEFEKSDIAITIPEKPKFSTRKVIIKKYPFPGVTSILSFPAYHIQIPIKKRIALVLLGNLLAGSASSLLFNLLRVKKNLIYDIQKDFSSQEYFGMFSLNWTIGRESYIKVFKIIVKEINKLKNKKITLEELTNLRKIADRADALDFENAYDCANWVADEMLFEKQILLPEDYKKIRNQIVPADLSEVAKEVFDFKKINVVAVGRVKNLKIPLDLGK